MKEIILNTLSRTGVINGHTELFINNQETRTTYSVKEALESIGIDTEELCKQILKDLSNANTIN